MLTILIHLNIYKRWCLTWIPDKTSIIIFARNTHYVSAWNISSSEHKWLNKSSFKHIYVFFPKFYVAKDNPKHTTQTSHYKGNKLQQLSALLRTNTFYRHHFCSITKDNNKESKINRSCGDISLKVESGVIW